MEYLGVFDVLKKYAFYVVCWNQLNFQTIFGIYQDTKIVRDVLRTKKCQRQKQIINLLNVYGLMQMYLNHRNCYIGRDFNIS